jgi:hypothetical protein
MSHHIAVLITSEQCGHCRRMRGNGRLLSQNEIKKDNKQPTIPGGAVNPKGYFYDAIYMKRLLTAGIENSTKQMIKLINVHYKSFNPMEGIVDISIFNLEGNNVKQTILRESNGKTGVEVYVIGESGKQLDKKELPSVWSDSVKANVPINLTMYAHFFPILALFHIDAWNDVIQNSKPIYGYVNGLETKSEAPYGALQSRQPNVIEFGMFLKQFFDGTKKLEAVASVAVKSETPENPEKKVHFEEHRAIPPTVQNGTAKIHKDESKPATSDPNGLCSKINFKLYVKE